VVEQLQAICARGRLGHGYLFTGPDGCGKRLCATRLAQALLCERPRQPLAACQTCAACAQVEANTHPDLYTVGMPAESHELPIETIRELCAGLALKPARGGYKIAIVDDADDLNDAAANCFLKTLEEPPPNAVLILIGTNLERQLPTILSRCQLLRFAPLPDDVVRDFLIEQGTSPERAAQLTQLAGGSIGQALALDDEGLWNFRTQLIAHLSTAKPDTVALAKEWVKFYEETGKESAPQRRRVGLALRLLIDWLRQLLTASVGGEWPGVDEAEWTAYQTVAERLGTDRLLALVERCLEADRQLERKVQLVLIVESLCAAFAAGAALPLANLRG
jgi:DNA polymerase-3 subunit delta'